MIRRITAIATLCMREARRSRVITALLFLLLAAVVTVPLSVRGDGTVQGEATVLLSYTLGLTAILQALTTLWAACAGLPTDIVNGRLQMMVTKPVRPIEIWIGKWLGIAALNAGVTCAVFAIVLSLFHFRMNRLDLTDSEREALNQTVLNSRAIIYPELPAPAAVAKKWYETLEKRGELPEKKSKAEMLITLTKQAAGNHIALAPGHTFAWPYTVPFQPEGDHFWVEAEYSAAGGMVTPVDLACHVSTNQSPAVNQRRQQSAGQRIQFRFKREAMVEGDVTVRLTHLGKKADGAILISERTGVKLLVQRGEFASNLLRALIVTLSALFALAGIGLTCGALFSLPVAALASTAALIVLFTSQIYVSMPGHERFAAEVHANKALLYRVSSHALEGLGHLSAPVFKAVPYSSLSQGIRITWNSAWRALLFVGLAWPFILAPCTALILRRRELGKGGRQ